MICRKNSPKELTFHTGVCERIRASSSASAVASTPRRGPRKPQRLPVLFAMNQGGGVWARPRGRSRGRRCVFLVLGRRRGGGWCGSRRGRKGGGGPPGFRGPRLG